MSGTIIGGKKIAQKNIAREPDYYKRIGALGGKASGTGGFYANRELARTAGAKGGAISKRKAKTAEPVKWYGKFIKFMRRK